MPISASAKKSLRVSLRRTAENRAWKLRVKNQLKKTTVDTVTATISIIDKAAKHDVIHPNKASRLKSQLMKKFPIVATSPKTEKPKQTPKKAASTATKKPTKAKTAKA